jgi:hypothetical protein
LTGRWLFQIVHKKRIFCADFAIQNQRAATFRAMPDWSRDQFGQFTEKL